MNRGAWWATVHGVTNNWTRLSDWHTFQEKNHNFVGIHHFSILIFFLAEPHSMWDLSSQTRDLTQTRCVGSTVLTTGQPGKSAFTIFAGRKVITWQGLGHAVSGGEISEKAPTGAPCDQSPVESSDTLGLSKGYKQLGQTLSIFWICLHGKIRLRKQVRFYL